MSQPRIILYTTTTCPYSWEMRQHLQNRQLSYEEILIDQSDEAAAELQRLVGDMVTPVTVVAYDQKPPHHVVGFDRQKLDSLLDY